MIVYTHSAYVMLSHTPSHYTLFAGPSPQPSATSYSAAITKGSVFKMDGQSIKSETRRAYYVWSMQLCTPHLPT